MAAPEDGRYRADRRSQIARKLRDAAAVAPLAGAALLISPLFVAIGGGDALGGLVFIFSVWAVLIGVAFLLSRRLRDPDDGGRE